MAPLFVGLRHFATVPGMSRLEQELCRLYGPDGGAAERALPSPALVLELARPAQWAPLAAVWQGVQTDFGWPAPAIAVNGLDGLQLWFSIAQAVPLTQLQACARGLQRRYLGEQRESRLSVWPPTPPLAVPAGLSVPVLREERQVWSAFVAPDLAAIFEETPWLDLPPGREGQAGLLARCRSITPALWQAALEMLTAASAAPAAPPPGAAAVPAPALPTAGREQARDFLWRVMQDESAPLALRVEAAKALLSAG